MLGREEDEMSVGVSSGRREMSMSVALLSAMAANEKRKGCPSVQRIDKGRVRKLRDFIPCLRAAYAG